MASGEPAWWQNAPGQLASFVQHVRRQFIIGDHNTLASKSSSNKHARAAAAPYATIVSHGTSAPSREPSSIDSSSWSAGPTRSTTRTSQSSADTNKAELGRATWVLLHTLAAQFPAQPTKHQRADVKTFITSLSKVYPCGECAKHFQQVVRYDSPLRTHMRPASLAAHTLVPHT
jgi:hypothetical protein